MTDTLQAAIVALARQLAEARHRTVEDAIAAASDQLATGDRNADRVIEEILEGIRWGHRAAGTDVSLMVRIIEPGGMHLTHEWGAPLPEATKSWLVRAVMAAIEDARP